MNSDSDSASLYLFSFSPSVELALLSTVSVSVSTASFVNVYLFVLLCNIHDCNAYVLGPVAVKTFFAAHHFRHWVVVWKKLQWKWHRIWASNSEHGTSCCRL